MRQPMNNEEIIKLIKKIFSEKIPFNKLLGKVSVTRTELHNDKNKLIAVGTGTYIVG